MIVNAIMNTGNDVDIVEISLRHNLSKLNQILVIDNNSTDGTKDVIEKLILEYGEERLKLIHTDSKTPNQHVVTINFFKEQIKLSGNQPDFLFFLDADELIYADDFSELNLIPENNVGIVKWKCYIPNRLDHVDFPKEMEYRRESEPEGCHKVVIPSHCNGFLILGNHYLHQDHKRAASYELKTISLAHYPVRSIEQMNKKIEFITKFLKYEDPSQSYHLRSYTKLETLEELINKAIYYAENNKVKRDVVYDPLVK